MMPRVHAAEALERDDTDYEGDSISDDVPDATDTSDGEGDTEAYSTESESDAFDVIEEIVGRAYASEGGTAHLGARRPRTLMHAYTPQAWHNLLHSGKKISEATAKMSDARFEINGKIKLGSDLNDNDLALLEHARASCDVCKQAKLTAPHARTTKSVHNTTAGRGRTF